MVTLSRILSREFWDWFIVDGLDEMLRLGQEKGDILIGYIGGSGLIETFSRAIQWMGRDSLRRTRSRGQTSAIS
jgi:hypothetical protein